MKYFIQAIRPITLHQKVNEKKHKCHTLAEVYQLALAEEKELARIRKLRNEEQADKPKGVRALNTTPTVDETKQATPSNKTRNNNKNKNNDNNVPLLDRSTTWLMEDNRCAFCTARTNDTNKPHAHTDCMDKYPFYSAKEVREHLKQKKVIPPRTQWPEDRKNKKRQTTASLNLKGPAGSNK
jgi:hypothetical protein